MPDSKISDLPAVTDIADTDLLTTVRPGDPAGTKNKRITGANVKQAVSYLSRTGTTLEPATAGDDLDMGTGDVNAANVDVTANYQISNNRVLAVDTNRGQLFVGYNAGINTQINGIAYRNTALGEGALETNVQGGYNTAIGFDSLNANANLSNAGENTAIGALCLVKATGENNTAMGSHTGGNQDDGDNNVFIGAYAGLGGSGPTTYTKNNNTMIGYSSGHNCLSGNGNVFLGYFSGFNETGSNKLYIENSNSADPLIYGEFDTNLVKINGTFQSTGNVTIGAGAAGVDYTLTFDGENNDGVITWLEDEDAFDMSCGFSLNAGQIITEFSTDGTLAGDSDAAISTEKAIKTYVDASSSVDKPKYETLSIGTGSLTATSSYLYLHTASVKTVFLPNATTLVNGQAFYISNNGTYNTPILLSDSSSLLTLKAGETIRIVCIDNSTTNGSWNIIDKIIIDVNEQQIYSIGVDGLNTNSGLNINEKMDEPSTAITAIDTLRGGAWTPSAAEAVKIDCRDSGTYVPFTLSGNDAEYVNVDMAKARTSGASTVTIGDNTNVQISEIETTASSNDGVTKSGTGSAVLKFDKIIAASGVTTYSCINVTGGTLISNGGDLVVDSTTDNGITIANGTTIYYKGGSCNGLITIGDNCTATIELNTLGVAADTGNISIGNDSIIFLKVHGNWAGYFSSIGTNTTVNVIAGSRTATSSDSGASGVVRNRIVLGRDSDSTTYNPELYFESGGKLTITDTYIGRLNSVYFDTDTETTGFSYNGTCGIKRLDSASTQTLTFNQSPADVGIDWQNNGDFCYFANVNTGSWTIVAGTATIKSNRPLTPIEPNETVIAVREDKTTYHLFRSELNQRTDAGAANYNPSALTSDRIITADNTAAARNIIISTEDIESGSTTIPRIFTVKDEYLNAATYNLTITLENSGTIDGAASYVISTNSESLEFYSTGTNCFIK